MLISPPFLPTRAANQQDEDWVDSAMPGGQPASGAFPVSLNLGWHGGMHVTAPMNGRDPLPVRAIADGTVVYVRQPTPPNNDTNHALNYNGGWTSDGVVVARHETALGTGDADRVVFFSIYMHLSGIDPSIVQNQPVYRKHPIGEAGQIYGSRERQIHFEIICDDANLLRIVGRASGDVPLDSNGRTSAVYGEVYIRLPSGTRVYAEAPAANVAAPPAATAPVYTTTEDLFIGLSYGRGNLSVTTYRADGSVVEAAIVVNDAEYGIYERTGELSRAYTADQRPVRSAVYELLYFGRPVTGETLTPADMPHWREIAYPGGRGQVNLNAQGTMKYSDADFPQWRRWSLVDDSADHDSRCDSQTIRGWLDQNGDGTVARTETTARLDDATVRAKLARAICKFPTEWEAATINARWSWLMQATVENPSPLSAADFEDLRRHITALSFWQQANLQVGDAAMPAEHWHFQPREAIKHFRKCGWLSQTELARCLPRRSQARGRGGAYDWATIGWGAANTRAGTNLASVNRFLHKFIGADRQRHAHALAQIYIETALLGTMTEFGRGQTYDYGAFYGRGLMQLTWPPNYEGYGQFKGLANQAAPLRYSDTRINATSTHLQARPREGQQGRYERWAPRYDPDIVGTQAEHSADSAGYYWVSKAYFRNFSNINRVCDLGLTGTTTGFVSWLVNGGGNGYRERQGYMRFVRNVLLDEVPLTGTETWNYPAVGAAHPAFPPGDQPNTQSTQVDYTRQAP